MRTLNMSKIVQEVFSQLQHEKSTCAQHLGTQINYRKWIKTIIVSTFCILSFMAV